MRSLELFSGAGGLALGIEAAGFEHVALVERDADACATLRHNRPNWKILESDVRKIQFSDFGPVDLVAGGPPCQPFSIGGKAQGSNDQRDMFPQAVRAVKELSPAAFLFENVRGLLRSSFANYVEFIRLQLTYPEYPVSPNVSWEGNLRRLQRHHTSKKESKRLTYRVSLHLVDAADYGVPQHRHRVFFVGFRSDVDAQWSFPAPTHTEDELLRSKFITGDYWREHGMVQRASLSTRSTRRIDRLKAEFPILMGARWQTVRDAIKGLPVPSKDAVIANHVLQPGAKTYPGHTGSLLDDPSKALKAGDHGVPGGENMMNYGNGRVRYYTVRESARIQTFPDDYVFSGSWTESMRQLGNAVPVHLARVVAESIHRKLVVHNGTRVGV